MVRSYEHAGRTGCVELRRSRSTGTIFGLYHAEQAGLDAEGGPWVTVCEDHGAIVNHTTLRLARSHSPDTMSWCDDCRREGESIRVDLRREELDDVLGAIRSEADASDEGVARASGDPVRAARIRALVTKLEGLQQ